jgi:hypothetical protein
MWPQCGTCGIGIQRPRGEGTHRRVTLVRGVIAESRRSSHNRKALDAPCRGLNPGIDSEGHPTLYSGFWLAAPPRRDGVPSKHLTLSVKRLPIVSEAVRFDGSSADRGVGTAMVPGLFDK